MRKEEYLNIVEGQIRCRQARIGVCDELKGHIEDQTEAYLLQGMTAREAEEAAVMDMGDPVETGNEMNRIHRPRMPWKSIGLIVGISLVTFLLQYVLRVSEPSQEVMMSMWIPGGDLRYLALNVIGWCIMIGICYLDYSRIGKYAPGIMGIGCIGILMAGFFTNRVNGNNYFVYISLLGTSISIHTLVFLFVPMYGAILWRYRGDGYSAIGRGILWMMPSLWLALSRGGVSVALIVGSTYMVILTVAVLKNWFVVSKRLTLSILWAINFMIPLLGGVYIMNQGVPYQQARLQVFLNPYSTEAGYQIVKLRKLLAGSQMVGSKTGFLQDAQEVVETGSYALSMIWAYYGRLVAVALAVGIVLLFCRFFQKSLGQKNQMGMIMGTGVSTVFLVELLFYILANAGILSSVSHCPFLGYGGSGIMITYILLGVLLSVYRYENVVSEHKFENRMIVSGEKS